jgi:3',5'-cyclic AMP phosphodiesterase CpdA
VARRVAHISDLHFGRIDPVVVEGLARALAEARPDLVVASGDFTQRARDAEFAAARTFLDRLPAPVFAVPGNHDLPSFNLLERFWDPYGRYRQFIAPELEPVWQDAEIGIVGIKSSRRLPRGGHWAMGRIGRRQLTRALDRLTQLPADLVRIVVVHHPLLLPDEPGRQWKRHAFTGGAGRAMAAFAAHRVQLVLSGHLHLSYSRHHVPEAEGPPAVVMPMADAAEIKSPLEPVPTGPLVVQAASATSTRLRNEPNAFNLITIADGKIEVEVHAWDGRRLFAAVRPLAPAEQIESTANAVTLPEPATRAATRP